MRMKVVIITILIFFSGCAVGNYTSQSNKDKFQPNVCMNIPVGVEAYQYMDPGLKNQKISCADLVRCTSLYSLPAPPNVPCE